MELRGFFLDGLIDSTTPPNESERDAQIRAAAIADMFDSMNPTDAMQAMLACQCIATHFLLRAINREAANTTHPPALLTRIRAQAMSANRMASQQVRHYEKMKAPPRAKAAVKEKAPEKATPRPAVEPADTEFEPPMPMHERFALLPEGLPPEVAAAVNAVFGPHAGGYQSYANTE